MDLPTFIFTDAHKTGLGAILAQGTDSQSAKLVVIASRSITKAEARYPQLDPEALVIDFGLHKFRDYFVGSPISISDHNICPIFNKKHT